MKARVEGKVGSTRSLATRSPATRSSVAWRDVAALTIRLVPRHSTIQPYPTPPVTQTRRPNICSQAHPWQHPSTHTHTIQHKYRYTRMQYSEKLNVHMHSKCAHVAPWASIPRYKHGANAPQCKYGLCQVGRPLIQQQSYTI